MDEKIEEEGLRHLEKIEENTEEIKRRAPGTKRAFLNGVMHGVGAVIGSLLTVLLLGWILSSMGFFPGVREFVEIIRGTSPVVH